MSSRSLSEIASRTLDPGATPATDGARVTIGYDAPWRKVHELLLAAAARAEGVLATPAPFVVQEALNDATVALQTAAELGAAHTDESKLADTSKRAAAAAAAAQKFDASVKS